MCTLWTKGVMGIFLLATRCIMRTSHSYLFYRYILKSHVNTHLFVSVCVCHTWLDYAYACHDVFIHTCAISITSLISCICFKWLSFIHICAMTHPTVYVPWLIQPYARHPSHRFGLLRSFKRLIQPYVCYDWCLHMCVMTHQTTHSSLCVPRWFLRMCAKTDSAIRTPPPYMHAHSHTHTLKHTHPHRLSHTHAHIQLIWHVTTEGSFPACIVTASPSLTCPPPNTQQRQQERWRQRDTSIQRQRKTSTQWHIGTDWGRGGERREEEEGVRQHRIDTATRTHDVRDAHALSLFMPIAIFMCYMMCMY